jgi:putative drug exporter of the RND superfamily
LLAGFSPVTLKAMYMQKLADFVVRRAWWIIATWVIAAGLIIGLSPTLSSVESNDQSSFVPGSYESVKATNVATKLNPKSSGANDIIVFQNTAHGNLTASDQQQISQIVNSLQAAHLPHIQSVVTSSQEISPNHTVQLATVSYLGNAQDTAVIDSVVGLRNAINTETKNTAITAGLTGGEAISYDTQGAFNNALKIVSIGTILLILILPAVVFRSIISGLLPVISVGLVFTVASSLIADAAKFFDFKVSQQLSVLFTVVIFGVGTDYILFLLFRYRERLKTGDHSPQAVAFALSRAGEAILSAALVVISSFVAMFFAKFGIFHTFAPGLVICVGTMLLAALTLVPALVSILGPKVFWPSKAWQKPKADRPTVSKRLGGLVARRPAMVGGIILTVLIVVSLGSLWYKADFSSFSQPPTGTASAAAYKTLQAAFPAGASSPTDVYITSNHALTMTEANQVSQALSHAKGVANSEVMLLTADKKTAVINVTLSSDPYSSQALSNISGPIRVAAHSVRLPAGTNVYVGGVSSALADVQAATNRDMRVVFPIAALFIFIILSLLLRSVVAPLFLLLSVSLGFAATLGITTVLFTKIGSAHGLIFFLPIMLYIFVVAIGTDYNILTVTRLREEIREGHSPRRAADLTIEHSSATVASAGLILAGTFASLLLARISLLTQMGSAIAIGVVLAAFVIAPIIIPSVSALLGYAIWWPGHRPGKTKTSKS